VRYRFRKPNEPFIVFAWFPIRTEDTDEFVWFERVWKVKRRWNSGWDYYSCKQNIKSGRGGGLMV
jgi:hypothetical protein